LNTPTNQCLLHVRDLRFGVVLFSSCTFTTWNIVHNFHDDKTSKFQVTYDTRSVIIYNEPPEPNIDPVANPPSLKDSYVIKRSSPLAVLYIKSAGKWVLMNLRY
jgi:hypothetical protein